MVPSSRRRWALRAVVCGLLCSGLPAACGIPDYRFEDSSNPDIRPRCTVSSECASFPSTRICDVVAGRCVECLPGSAEASKGCTVGLFCAGSRCAVGCDSNADCTPLSCDLTLHRCTGCSSDANCPKGTGCQDGECVPSCSSDANCPLGFACCSGVCANTKSDPLHCGSCPRACADDQQCINSECGAAGGCAPGFADCDGDSRSGCETNTKTDQRNCGECSRDCGPKYCRSGVCSTIDCESTELADCDGNSDNGCETNLNTSTDCGACGKACGSVNGTPTCSKGKCGIVCDDGYADCDGNSDNGCEANVNEDTDNCGSCGTSCTNENGSTYCSEGRCSPSCGQGFANCDGDPDNGCETDLRTAENCGACGVSCDLDHASEQCKQGLCRVVACDDGFEDCDGNPDNGCEADLTSTDNCGACGNSCIATGGVAACNNAECTITCKPGYSDCVNGVSDGCETKTSGNVRNCGTCGNECEAGKGLTPTCFSGKCDVTQCSDPFVDCVPEEDPGGAGCETNGSNDRYNCGGCGIDCTAQYPHGIGTCVAKSCSLDRCNSGWADCSPDKPGCETQLQTKDHCTSCSESCRDQHGTNKCTANGCQPSCEIGWGDCDGIPENGCETSLNSKENCGTCGVACDRDHAATSCSSGVCVITSCNSGFGDCDNEPVAKTGCETPLNTRTDCASCDTPCALPHASTSCATGACSISACDDGFADCSGSLPGCETQLGTNSNCQTCGNACQTSNVHVTQNVCVGTPPRSDCSPTCQNGFKSCDGDPDNGCEIDITTPSNCGDCNVVCGLPHTQSHACMNGACQVATCESGWAACNSVQSDGCERDVRADVNNCGDCNHVCSSSHGTPSCAQAKCSISCADGFGNCDTDVSNGCETPTVDDPKNCGGCGKTCAGFCVGTSCVPHLTIAVVGTPVTASESTAGANLTVSHTLVSPAGSYRLILVGVAGQGNNGAGKPSSVTYDNRQMTLIQETLSSNQAWAGVYAIGEAALPGPGQHDVQVNAGSAQNTFGLIANVLELRNVQQPSPYLKGGTAGGVCSADAPSDSVTTVAEGAFVYGAVGLYNGALASSGWAASGQTVTAQTATPNRQLYMVAGYVTNVAPPRAVEMKWAPGSCSTSAQAIVGIAPASTP